MIGNQMSSALMGGGDMASLGLKRAGTLALPSTAMKIDDHDPDAPVKQVSSLKEKMPLESSTDSLEDPNATGRAGNAGL